MSRELLLVFGNGRVISFDSPEKKGVRVYPTTAVVNGAQPRAFVFPDYPYSIEVVRE
ncbi:MAG: hypothetical protein ACKV0T_05660 [Planctomycetales bacterium]